MSIYGYVKNEISVSVLKQLESIQIYPCDDIYTEEGVVEGVVKEEVLETLLLKVVPGDTIVIESLLVFEKSLKELKELLDIFSEKKIKLVSVSDQFDSSKMLYGYEAIDLLIKNESAVRGQLVKRQLALLRSKGMILGRPTIGQEKIDDIVRLHESQKLSMREIAEICDVSLGTVHKYSKLLQVT